jgi:uncharacterized protein involved in outer membrane biogenesis
MKKIVLAALLVLLITLGFGVYYLLSNLDSIVKAAIETYGSEATRTAVRVDKVKIGLKDGSGAVRGLTVDNPQGFTTPRAFSLGEISTQVDLKSLSQDVTVIEHITVQAPEVFFELNRSGKNNLEALKQNLASGQAAGGKDTSAGQNSGAGGPKLIIRKLLFENGNIHASIVPLQKDFELKLPSIELRDLGGKQGATPKQIADQVLKALTDRALAQVKQQGIDQYKSKLEGEVNQRLGAGKEKIGEQAGDKLKDLINY